MYTGPQTSTKAHRGCEVAKVSVPRICSLVLMDFGLKQTWRTVATQQWAIFQLHFVLVCREACVPDRREWRAG